MLFTIRKKFNRTIVYMKVKIKEMIIIYKKKNDLIPIFEDQFFIIYVLNIQKVDILLSWNEKKLMQMYFAHNVEFKCYEHILPKKDVHTIIIIIMD